MNTSLAVSIDAMVEKISKRSSGSLAWTVCHIYLFKYQEFTLHKMPSKYAANGLPVATSWVLITYIYQLNMINIINMVIGNETQK